MNRLTSLIRRFGPLRILLIFVASVAACGLIEDHILSFYTIGFSGQASERRCQSQNLGVNLSRFQITEGTSWDFASHGRLSGTFHVGDCPAYFSGLGRELGDHIWINLNLFSDRQRFWSGPSICCEIETFISATPLHGTYNCSPAKNSYGSSNESWDRSTIFDASLHVSATTSTFSGLLRIEHSAWKGATECVDTIELDGTEFVYRNPD